MHFILNGQKRIKIYPNFRYFERVLIYSYVIINFHGWGKKLNYVWIWLHQCWWHQLTKLDLCLFLHRSHNWKISGVSELKIHRLSHGLNTSRKYFCYLRQFQLVGCRGRVTCLGVRVLYLQRGQIDFCFFNLNLNLTIEI